MQPSTTLQSPGSSGWVFQPVMSLPLKSLTQPSASWAWLVERKPASIGIDSNTARRRMGRSERVRRVGTEGRYIPFVAVGNGRWGGFWPFAAVGDGRAVTV